MLLQLVLTAVLVAIPLWRSLSHERRALAAVLLLMIAWLGIFGWIEDQLGMHFNLLEHWRWDDELVDLVRWVGWIPPALLLHRRLSARAPHLATH
jgi:hypothetical protein